MRFFFHWIRREVQNDGWWVSLFVLSLALGLLGFIGLESFRDSLDQSLRSQAKTFLSADLATSSRRTIKPEELAKIRQIASPIAESHLVELMSMAASTSGSRLVQLKAIDTSYPLYGELKLGSGRTVGKGQSQALFEKPRVWVYPEILSQLQVKIGDTIKIGKTDFEVADTVETDSTQTLRLGGLAPKAYLANAFLGQTGLVGFGTTFSDVYLFQLPPTDEEQARTLSGKLEREFQDPNLQFQTPLGAAQDSARGLQSLLDYLGLVSLVGMALALVGLGYLTQLYLSRRIATLSLLRTLGLKARLAELFVAAELALLGTAAAVVVLIFAALVLPPLGRTLSEVVPIPLVLGLSLRSASVCLLLASALPVFIALPLLRPFREVNLKQVLLDQELWQSRPKLGDLVAWLPAAVLYFVLALWVSHSLRIATYFFVGLLISAVIIFSISVVIMKGLPSWQKNWRWTQARLRLARAPLRFSVVILALSFGTLLLVLLPQIRDSIKAELSSPESVRLPSFFLFDIQDDQIQGLQDFLKDRHVDFTPPSPLIRARLLAINGVNFERTGEKKEFQSREEENEARFRNRGVNLTFRSKLSDSEELESGQPFSPTPGAEAELSVEKKYAERLGMKIGDKLQFDVQGVQIEGHIVNLRSVLWNSFQPNFFIAFQPGFLDEAPKTWLTSLPPVPEASRNELQNEIVKRFPNVSLIDVSRVIAKVLELTDQMTMALTAMALISVVVGLFVLFTVLLTEARNRLVEWNLYKVLGASENSILQLFLIESGLVASVSVVLGGILGTALSFVLMHFVFEAPFQFSIGAFLAALLFPFVFSLILSWQLGRRLTRSEASQLLAESR